MNNSKMLALFDQDQRYNITFPDLRREMTPRSAILIGLPAVGHCVTQALPLALATYDVE